MKLDIGIASWQNPDRLDETITALRANTQSDWKLFVIDNASPDPRVKEVIERHAREEPRVVPVYKGTNTGYAGAVNQLLRMADTEFVAYVDNDCVVRTNGWDTALAVPLQRHHEVAMAFPATYVSYPIKRPDYTEILWGTGCFWMLKRARTDTIGFFDEELGHQEEVDYQTRLRLDGWRIVAVPGVNIHHYASSTVSPEAAARIEAGVIRWVNKWAAYFGGKAVNYHSPNVIRFEDWPVNALYLEEWYKERLPDLNHEPETLRIEGREYDLIKVPRYRHLYRERII